MDEKDIEVAMRLLKQRRAELEKKDEKQKSILMHLFLLKTRDTKLLVSSLNSD